MQSFLKDIMNSSPKSNNNMFITKIAEKRRRRKAIKKANKNSGSLIHEDEVDYTESTARGSDKRVRFGSNSVAVYDGPLLDASESSSSQQENDNDLSFSTTIRKDQLWYNSKDLNEQFVKDLEAHVKEQVQRAQAGDYTSSYSLDRNSSRGLEFHFNHNQRRKEQAEAYVKHIVEKSNAIRKEAGLSISNNKRPSSNIRRSSTKKMMSKLGRKLDRRMAMIKSGSHHDFMMKKFDPIVAEQYAEEIQEYCSQYTQMAQELAIGVAASDAAEAKAIYDEEEEEEQEPTTIEKTGSTDFVVHQQQRRRPSPQPTKLKQPLSYNAKSA